MPRERRKVGTARYDKYAVLGRNLRMRGKRKWRVLSFLPADDREDALRLFAKHQRANYDPKEGWEFDAKRV